MTWTPTRRRLLGSLAIAGGALAAPDNFVDVKPSPQQVAWQDLEVGVLIHFGPNSFMDREWGDGSANPSVFKCGPAATRTTA